MGNRTETSFASLAPVFKQAVHTSLAPEILSAKAVDVAKEALPQAVRGYGETSLQGSVSPFSIGILPYRVDLISRLIIFAVNQQDLFRERLAQLPPDEKQAILELLPDSLREYFRNEQPKSSLMSGVALAARTVVAISDAGVQVGKAGGQAVGLISESELGDRLRSGVAQATEVVRDVMPPSAQETSMIVIKGLGVVGKDFLQAVVNFAGSVVEIPVHHTLTVVEHHLLPITDTFIDETSAHLDKLAEKLPPAKLLGTAYHSLLEFSQLNLEASKTTNPATSPRTREMTKLYRMMTMGKFPGGREGKLHKAFQELFVNAPYDGTRIEFENGLKTSLLRGLNGHLTELTRFKTQYEEFCRKNQLEGFPGHSLELIEAAFYIKSLQAAGITINEDCLFLAEMVLLDPQRALVNTEKAIKDAYGALNLQAGDPLIKESDEAWDVYRKEAHLDEPSQDDMLAFRVIYISQKLLERAVTNEAKAKFQRNIALAKAHLNGISRPERLIELAGILYIKQTLCKTAFEKLLPKVWHDRIVALGKIGGYDALDLLGNVLARAFMEQGPAFLTDPLAFSNLIMNLFYIDSSSYMEHSLGEGESKLLQERFLQFCQQMNQPGHTLALKNLTLGPTRNRTRQQLGEEASSYLSATLLSWSQQYNFGFAYEAISKDVSLLQKRKDWGILTLMLAGKLNSALQDPEATPALNMKDDSTYQGIQTMMEALAPNLALQASTYLPSKLLENKFIKWFVGTFFQFRDMVEQLDYPKIAEKLKNALHMQTLTTRYITSLRFHSDQPFPKENEALLVEGISRAFVKHIDDTVEKAWGVPSTSTEFSRYQGMYMEYLLSLDKKELLNVVQKAATDPQSIQTYFIKQTETQLANLEKEADRIISNPTTPIPLQEISKELQRIERELASIVEATPNAQARRQSLLLEKDKFLKMKQIHDLHRQMKDVQTDLEHLYSAKLKTTSLADIQMLRKKIATAEKNLAEAPTLLKEAEDDLEAVSSTLAGKLKISHRLVDELQKTQLAREVRELGDRQQALTKKVDSLRNLPEALSLEIEHNKRIVEGYLNRIYELDQRGALIDAVLQEEISTDIGNLSALKNLLLHLYKGKNEGKRVQDISKIEVKIQELEKKIKETIEASKVEKAKIYMDAGKMAPHIQKKMDFLGLMIKVEKPELNLNPIKKKRILEQMKSEYLYLEKFEYGIGLGVPENRLKESYDVEYEYITNLRSNYAKEIDDIDREIEPITDALQEIGKPLSYYQQFEETVSRGIAVFSNSQFSPRVQGPRNLAYLNAAEQVMRDAIRDSTIEYNERLDKMGYVQMFLAAFGAQDVELKRIDDDRKEQQKILDEITKSKQEWVKHPEIVDSTLEDINEFIVSMTKEQANLDSLKLKKSLIENKKKDLSDRQARIVKEDGMLRYFKGLDRSYKVLVSNQLTSFWSRLSFTRLWNWMRWW